jgi:hypothetical protein
MKPASPQMPLADDQNMIQALTPKRSDQAFSVWVLHAGSRTLEKIRERVESQPCAGLQGVCVLNHGD